ncbi:DinB family protein [Bacillus massilinigeriensis]|uniref:DinB family protein n=1 Tax=Bacillus massilionigeriensis TaxID=1805475 RepID=UPI001F2F2B67|nr:DinB family protein [Bacillus massilionigeriensis]
MNQLFFVRKNTISYVKDLSENVLKIVPLGLNNHIKWNLGHIYVISEKFCFTLTREETKLPANFNKLFDPGTSPSHWEIDPHEKNELIYLLNEQISRIESVLSGRMEEKIKQPYTTSTGLELVTIGELISFCLYHEGMHFGAIKNIHNLTRNI